MSISSFAKQNGTLATPLLMSNPQLGLVFTKTDHCFEYTPLKSFNSFVHSAADAKKTNWRKSSVVAETMKLPPNSSYGYKIMDPSWNNVTKYLSYEKTLAADNKNLAMKLDHLINSMYKAELSKAQINHKEPILVGFFNLQYAKLRTLQLYYKFFTEICGVHKSEELGIDTDSSLYLAFAEKELQDCVKLEMKTLRMTAVKRLQWQFHCWCIRKFLSANVLWQALKLGQERTGTFERRICCT